MKVIFLDIDGVLNTADSAGKPRIVVEDEKNSVEFNQLDKLCVETFNKIVEAIPDVKIVITSTWRIDCIIYHTLHLLYKHLKLQGIKGDMIGSTPKFPDYRDKEIEWWLNNNKSFDIEKYVIIDDDLDFFSEKPEALVHVQPSRYAHGIQQEHVEEAIKKLS